MGERGPLPKENAVRRNKREVTGTVVRGRPTMPSDLPKEAKAEWRRIVPELERSGMLTKLDRGLLIRYCTAWADWHELDAQLAKTGRLVKGRDGLLVRSPLWLMRRDAEKVVTELGRQLGLTPDARIRSGLKHTSPDADQPTRAADPQVTDFDAARRKRIAGGS